MRRIACREPHVARERPEPPSIARLLTVFDAHEQQLSAPEAAGARCVRIHSGKPGLRPVVQRVTPEHFMSIGIQRAFVTFLALQACSAESPTQGGMVPAF